MRWLLLLYPWLELLSLIQLGVETNALFALGWVLATLFLGLSLLRRAGFASIDRLREAQMGGVLRQQVLLDDMSMAMAALLLMIPGLLSDLLAVVVLIGPLRRGVARWLFGSETPRYQQRPEQHRDSDTRGPVTLEGDFRRVDEDDSNRS